MAHPAPDRAGLGPVYASRLDGFLVTSATPPCAKSWDRNMPTLLLRPENIRREPRGAQDQDKALPAGGESVLGRGEVISKADGHIESHRSMSSLKTRILVASFRNFSSGWQRPFSRQAWLPPGDLLVLPLHSQGQEITQVRAAPDVLHWHRAGPQKRFRSYR